VRVEGLGVAGPNNPDSCKTTGVNPWTPHDGLTAADCIQTNLMTVVGKVSTKGGVEVARATYSTDSTGKAQLDVFAASKAGQNITVQGGAAVPTTTLRDDATVKGEDYFAHLDVTTVSTAVDVINHSDNPETVKHVTVTDQVTGTATYTNTSGRNAEARRQVVRHGRQARADGIRRPDPGRRHHQHEVAARQRRGHLEQGRHRHHRGRRRWRGHGRRSGPRGEAPPTVAPTLGASTGGVSKVTLACKDVARTDATVDHYGVQLLNANGDNIGALRSTPEQANKADQDPDDRQPAPRYYMFTVKAGNPEGYGPESVKSGKLTVTTAADTVAITSAKWKAGNEFRVAGSSSTTDTRVTVSIYPAVASGPNGTLASAPRPEAGPCRSAGRPRAVYGPMGVLRRVGVVVAEVELVEVGVRASVLRGRRSIRCPCRGRRRPC
jgi:hypothetical protein